VTQGRYQWSALAERVINIRVVCLKLLGSSCVAAKVANFHEGLSYKELGSYCI
jgi:hypothetical protein